MAGHCAEYARSSGGWVYVGDLMRKMTSDGVVHATIALTVHCLTMLPLGEADVLGIKVDGSWFLTRQ
eukprot:5181265-Pyramimonas_sp.AAC.1